MSTPHATIPGSLGPANHARLAHGLWKASALVFVAMPVGMVIAHRSSPAFIVLSAALALAAVAAEGRLRPLMREAASMLASPLAIAVLAFFGWCLISIGWSEFKAVSLNAFGEFWLPIAAAFVLSLTLARRMPRRMFRLLTWAFLIASIMILLELATGLALRRAIGLRADSFIFNRPVLTLLMLVPPLIAWFLSRGRRGWFYGLGLLLVFSATTLRSESDAAVLGLLIVGLSVPFAWYAPRATCALAALAFLIAMGISPIVGPITNHLIPASVHTMLASGHSRERVALWTSFGAAVRKQPFLGGGFGVSPRMAETAVAQKVPVDQRRMLAIGHPHNAALQIWSELGAVGAVLALGIIFLILYHVARQPRAIGSVSLALIAGAAPVALVGHGAWQGWWAASLGAAIIWLLVIARLRSESRL
ncbi:O-antigen ligase family protein [Microvirga arsenatis]|uniref:O-antigen ligase domain-containing protein n=1 Tax=Microvirga arsenatis TaxID=2692265 RepID=A0ABW9YRX5_9HYPH|nr:O-antigen ligase family protein [Microvirga arsenatis]NBJ11566.1 O-antigen ligase domain-containing protein [Microvirga arsenatis]NBJ22775.1 O-antigen ligase domain-containing protein [Microvirga arsenatis]